MSKAEDKAVVNPSLMQRSEIKKQLTILERHVRLTITQNFTEANELEEQISDIKPCFATFNNVQNQIKHMKKIDIDEFERKSFKTSYYRQIAKTRSLITTFRPLVNNNSPSHFDQNNSNLPQTAPC